MLPCICIVVLAKATKNARKRQKRRDAANRMAEEELAEISIEQEVLKEISAKHQQKQQKVEKKSEPSGGGGGGKKSKQPISLNTGNINSRPHHL